MANISDMIAAFRTSCIIDLTHTLEERIPSFKTHSKFYHPLWSSPASGARALSYQLVMHEHNGTHVDAPAHFTCERQPGAHVTIENVPLTQLIGRGVRVNWPGLREGECVLESYLRNWEQNHGDFLSGDIVIFEFGWAARWALSPEDLPYVADWPGVSMGAAEYLLQKHVAAIGVDTLSPDPPGVLATNPIHPVMLEKQILIIENLTNLEKLPDFFLFIALPLKIRGGSGSPIRAIAVV